MFHNGITVAVRSGTDDWQKRFLLGWLELSQVPGSSGRVAAARPIPAFWKALHGAGKKLPERLQMPRSAQAVHRREHF
jgi:hypothetical protein